jgi:hypothetical protein
MRRLGRALAVVVSLVLATVPGVLSSGRGAAAADGTSGSRAGTPDSARVPAAPAALRDSLRISPQGMLAGDAAHVLAEPTGVLSDAFGRVWVSDAVLHKLRRWDANGQPLDETGTLGSETGEFRHPTALARVGSLGVAVLDVENRRVIAYDHHLRLLGAAVDLAAPDLEARVGRIDPVSLASDKGGAYYVADSDRDRILVFDYSGTFQREIGGYGVRAGGFSGLMAIATGPRGQLVTVERPRGAPSSKKNKPVARDSTTARARVQWLDAGGRPMSSAWTPAWAAGAGETGMSVAIDDSGRVVVSGERSGELFILSPAGACVGRMQGLASPRGLAFSSDGALLVAEAGAARVSRLILAPAGTE